MKYQSIEPCEELCPFVKNILVFKGEDKSADTNLPFFADGFPGMLYHNADRLAIAPHQKEFPGLFIYGQTIRPIEIQIKGAFTIIIFQLYPFVLKSLFEIRPEAITDNCYEIPDFERAVGNCKQSTANHTALVIDAITKQLLALVHNKKHCIDPLVKYAIEKIMLEQGQLSLTQLAEELHISKRTLERRFLDETALQPKLFAKIIQFQHSLAQISIKDFDKLTDVVYQNGYADQSHFIRVFKSFTGKSPGSFMKS